MTASARSRAALVTSATSARVGRGFFCIDSSICVATTTGLPASRHLATTVFCHVAIWASGTSTPKSPRATMIPSLFSMMSSMFCNASNDSILLQMWTVSPSGYTDGCFATSLSINCLMASTPAPSLTKEAATTSMPFSMPKATSFSSFALSAGRSRATPGRFTPFLSPISFVLAILVVTVVLPSVAVTSSVTNPSSNNTWSPTLTLAAILS
mmetsp:Transcript_22145/g.62295  ORF Transcript_22145/g.62295 Transcript_22145/m.62295 type:complete len:211 (+) Transcript_22145:449-1081(+)